MSDINSVVMVGRLTADADLRYTNSGFPVLTFSIASNRSVKKDDQWTEKASFFNAKMFGKRAESISRHLVKGSRIAISGYLNQESWEIDGDKHYKIVIVVNDIQLIDNSSQNRTTKGKEFSKAVKNASGATYPSDFEDDIPF